MKKLFLIDSQAMAYRAYYSVINNPTLDSDGKDISMVSGYSYQIMQILNEENPSHMAIVQDLPGPTFRHDMYPDYKANRKPKPEEMVKQLNELNSAIDGSGIKNISKPGFEADDLMGTLAIKAEKEGFQVFIVTRDKDMLQVVSDNIKTYETATKDLPPIIKGPDDVLMKFGIRADQVVDLLALMGDASDNVPGVRKVGQKSAAQLLNQYGSMEGIYENLYEITKKTLRENLDWDRDKAFLSKKLVKLDCQVDLDVVMNDMKVPADIEHTLNLG